MTAKHNIFYSALMAAAGLLLLLLLSFFLRNLPYAPTICAVAIIFYQIAIPLEILKWQHLRARDFNIYAHHIEALIDLALPPYGVKKIVPRFHDIADELIIFIKTSIVILIPYIFLYFLYFKSLALSQGRELNLALNLPYRLGYEIITQIFVVALPEELFYRGFLQSSLLKKWPNNRFVLNIPLGRAIIVTNIIFAFAHVASTLWLLRLLTFFPGLIFSYLAFKNRSILSAILFHALCNITGKILSVSVGIY